MLYKLLGLTILLGSFVFGWTYLGYQEFVDSPLHLEGRPLPYVLDKGTSLHQLADDLTRRGVIHHPSYLVWLGRRMGISQRLQAGQYEFQADTTPRELLSRIAAGKVLQYTLTLVEGWTFREVMEAIEAHDSLVHTLAGLSDAQIMARLGHPGQNPEGRFFPDTYFYPRGTTDLQFLQRAYQTMTLRLDTEWRRRAPGLPLNTPYQALILASIVEKETAVPAERAEIAGVYERRLALGMRLQADPTVIYGLGSAFDGNLRVRDLRHETPYNTYRNKGLPPTPIATPGLASIHAVLHPDPGKALYFVARGDGTHVFSETLAEQDRAVDRFQLHRAPKRPSPRSAATSEH
ncbi:MAG: aminodeoxychorismate lyase [Chromatiales bacterium 21-64-14]|nr:MAG: aminodeoxychorismate lyase [Chromatiales bacterium 21-64-14]